MATGEETNENMMKFHKKEETMYKGKKSFIIMALLFVMMVTTVGYASEITPRVVANPFDFGAVSETDNTSYCTNAVSRAEPTGGYAVITPTEATGEYHKLRMYVKYLGLSDSPTGGTRCTGYKAFSSSQFTIPYTSNELSTGFYALCGNSNYGLYTAKGIWSPG